MIHKTILKRHIDISVAIHLSILRSNRSYLFLSEIYLRHFFVS
nr:MAG TPA: hypothetical protein [Caudoviricetes sp.]